MNVLSKTAVFALVVAAGMFSGDGFAAQSPSLDRTLAAMAETGRQFRTLEADVERENVTVIVDDHAISSGRIYFEARGDESRIRMNLTEPARQELLVAEGKARVYNPRINQVQEVDLGEREDIAEYLVVGFGPANASLREHYEIELAGHEELDGTPVTVLDLTPKADRVRGMISRIRLWVDQEQWMPLQQRLQQPNGNYQIVRYSDLEVNGRIPGSTFELDLPDDVQIIR